MAKHTAGPWASRGRVVIAPQKQDGFLVTTVYDCDKLPGEASANARLIAAAPELYDLARTIVAICDSGNVNTAQLACMEGSPLVGEARSLLARIDGSEA